MLVHPAALNAEVLGDGGGVDERLARVRVERPLRPRKRLTRSIRIVGRKPPPPSATRGSTVRNSQLIA
jgi:hypothetical protein